MVAQLSVIVGWVSAAHAPILTGVAAARGVFVWLTCVGYRMLGDQDPDGRRVLRVDGRHYMTWTDEQGRPPETGHTSRADRPYHLLEDEIVRNARRLWLMGSIPDRFREQLPDNAAFLTPR